MNEYLKKTIFYLLLLLNLLLPLAIISHSLDGDLGWHLRFGRDLHAGPFPYTDTYTYSKYGMNWTNHEWGGDWLFWLIYSRLGYFWLDIITAISIFASFLIIGKTFSKKITITFLIISLICESSVSQIFVARLAMFTPLFFSLTILLIEKAKNNNRWLYLLPPLFWSWSVLHGSWILGFIIVNIYLAGAVFQTLLPTKYKKYLNEKNYFPSASIIKIILIQAVAALLITINPYGWLIWKEIFEYFGQNYYKMHITEWVPSYTYPIYWKILVIQTAALAMMVYGFYKKKINFTHLILFGAFFYAAFMYKRQAIFVGLLAVPIFEKTIEIMAKELSSQKILFDDSVKKIVCFFLGATLILLSGYYIFSIHFTNDVWNDTFLAEQSTFPYQAVNFLKNFTNQPIKIFNEFSWGGYLNWTLPNARVYLDGRGTATWMYEKNKSMLEHYFEILSNKDGLKEIEKDQVDFIFIKQPKFTRIAKPDAANEWFFSSQEIQKNLDGDVTQLEKSLDATDTWKKIYTDKFVNIWQNLNHAPR